MIGHRPSFDHRLDDALVASPPRVPVLVSGCGGGRTSALSGVRRRLGTTACAYIDVERAATTPERFLDALVTASPFHAPDIVRPAPASPRAAFDAALAFLGSARTAEGRPATFLLDEVLEIRTFENFPGLRSVMRDLVLSLGGSQNRFVLTTRYARRGRRVLQDPADRLQVIPVPPLSEAEIRQDLGERRVPGDDNLAASILALTEGHAAYAGALVETMTAARDRSIPDPISALAATLSRGGALDHRCRLSYELRLNRARGYGALKAILDVLAEDEPLTLTEIAVRLHRTPGSTKDYLSWLEDVDLVTAVKKRYRFGDPLLRLWVRLHCRTEPPGDETVAREVQTFALARLPMPAATPPLAGARAMGNRSWEIVEID